MPDTWLTSDLHLGHININRLAHRPFDTVEEMNDALITNWNETVRPDDDVWVAGDFAMGKIADTLPLALKLHGRKRLVLGNHDRPWDGHAQADHKRVAWMLRYTDAGFAIMPDGFYNALAPFYISHFPFEGDSHDEDRYEHMRPEDTGQRLLCGHVHEAWKTRGRMINCGVDVWDYKPVNLDTLRALAMQQ